MRLALGADEVIITSKFPSQSAGGGFHSQQLTVGTATKQRALNHFHGRLTDMSREAPSSRQWTVESGSPFTF